MTLQTNYFKLFATGIFFFGALSTVILIKQNINQFSCYNVNFPILIYQKKKNTQIIKKGIVSIDYWVI